MEDVLVWSDDDQLFPGREGIPELDVATAATSGATTASCVILVTPDGERTMNTFLGASQLLPTAALDETLIASAGILYLEGYLWDPEGPRRAMRRAIEVARAAGRKVAFTASESFVIDRHGDDFRALIEDGLIDILFVNEHELASLTGEQEFEAGLAALGGKLPVLVATRSARGAIAVAGSERAEVAAEPVAKVVDTTGAGDLFAAGFLTGHARGLGLERCLEMGAICAAEVISHYGARPEEDLKALIESEAVRTAVAGWRAAGERVALVPTMGNLHAGHFALVQLARKHAERVVASVFVNPTQFGPNEDFARYPRTPAEDAAGLEQAGCALLFQPAVEEAVSLGIADPYQLTEAHS